MRDIISIARVEALHPKIRETVKTLNNKDFIAGTQYINI